MKWLDTFYRKDIKIQEKLPTVVWIHGANQTSLSFEYLREKCNFSKEHCANYSSSNNFYYNLEKITEELQDIDTVFVIGHSMGGLYGIHLTQKINVVGGVSISTPFGGSLTADWAKYLIPTYPLFRDVGRRSMPVVEASKIKLDIHWTQIISTVGSVPYHFGQNDGVVTIESMNCRNDVIKIELPYNHYEIISNPQVADILKNEYQTIAPSHSATNI